MATIDSAATGNFSAGATWVGGVVPGVNDVARVLTGHTVTIDTNVTCQELRKDGAASSHTGNFVLGGTHTVTANITNACSGSSGSALVNFTLNSGTANVIGSVTGGTGSGHRGIGGAGTGTLSVVGDIANIGASNATLAIELTGATAVCSVTGNVTSASNIAIQLTGSSAQLTLTGNSVGGSVSTATGIAMSGASAQLFVTGNLTGGTIGGVGVSMTGTSSNADVVGTLTASTTSGALSSSGQVVLDGNFIDAPNGRASHTTALRRVRNTTNKYTQYVTPEISNANGSPVIRGSMDYITANVPLPANVRDGVVYSDSNFTGTLKVPPASSVASGVPTDNTTGTAALTPESVWEYVISGTSAETRLAGVATDIASSETVITNAISSAQSSIEGEIASNAITAQDVWEYEIDTSLQAGDKLNSTSTSQDVQDAALTADDVWDHETSDISVPSSIGARLKNSATVATTGEQIAAFEQ